MHVVMHMHTQPCTSMCAHARIYSHRYVCAHASGSSRRHARAQTYKHKNIQCTSCTWCTSVQAHAPIHACINTHRRVLCSQAHVYTRIPVPAQALKTYAYVYVCARVCVWPSETPTYEVHYIERHVQHHGHECMCLYVSTCIHVHTGTWNTYPCMRHHMHWQVCTCMHVRIYTRMCMYAHAHEHRQKHARV